MYYLLYFFYFSFVFYFGIVGVVLLQFRLIVLYNFYILSKSITLELWGFPCSSGLVHYLGVIMKSIELFNKKLYYKGNIDIINHDSIGVVGTRKPSIESVEFIKREVKKLSQEKVIISGLAVGTDRIAHETCIENDGLTIAILPSGLNKIYPLKHKKLVKSILENDGLIISEYEPDKIANRRRFIQRDGLIALFSDELLVPQCNIRSGTMHTVNFTKKLGKKIYVQDSNYEGNKYILRNYNNATKYGENYDKRN